MSIPAGATHVVADIYSLRDAQKEMNSKHPYRKKDGDLWLAFVDDEWVNVWLPDPSRYQKIDKQWSGPQDGLPPVGSTVEVFECTHDYTKRFNGQKVRILCHENDVAVFSAKNFEYHALVKDKFRPIRTEEQLAAEQRETAIREIMDIADVDCRVTAARLVDAGFKREVV
jgi:hypothetical protein